MGYISELIERMNSKEELPQTGPLKSSADTVSFQAHREAEKIQDTIHVTEMRKIANSSKRWRDVVDLAFICSWLIHNTNDTHAKEFYLSLRRDGASSETMMYLIDGATRAKMEEYADIVRKMMSVECRSNVHYSSGIMFLGKVLREKAVHEIGEALDNDCWGRCNPFYCCIQLGEIGSLDAIPYLQRAIERHKTGKKGWQRDVKAYGLQAMAEIEVSNK